MTSAQETEKPATTTHGDGQCPPQLPNEKEEHDSAATTNGAPKYPEKHDTSKSKGPSGGFDDTPVPARPSGYTLKITFHRAENLPVADIHGFSSDPYCLAQLNTHTPTRHKEDPYLRFRTPTIRKSLEPDWNEEWIVANVPSTGFKLIVRIYDEDPADHDDLLGKVHVSVPSLHDNWEGIKNQGYKLLAHDGSKRAYLVQALTTCFRENKHFRGHLYVSVEMLGKTQDDGQSGRVYTLGPCRWFRHYSPILGRLINIKDPDNDDDQQGGTEPNAEAKKAERYNFQANQVQLQGPVPAKLYHRYVDFKPWVSRMFTSSGLSGVVMGKALHHQHARVYDFGRSTLCGHFPQGPCEEMTKKFLDLVHYDQGGRIFTYVLTLDALFRFTETGKEFGIDMLSKHTMHSDVSIYIAFSGEFFVRRLKHAKRPPPPEPVEESSQSHPPRHDSNLEHPPNEFDDSTSGGDDAPKHPNYYELVIDNDSGTYRPNAEMLPLLKEFLARSLPGLHILTLDCNKDSEKQQKMKAEQRERKKKEGDHIIYTQGSRSSSISSSDEEELDHIQAGLLDENAIAHEHGPMSQAAKDAKRKNRSRLEKMRRDYLAGRRPDPPPETEEELRSSISKQAQTSAAAAGAS